jgi:hypothetical protein
VTGRDLIAPEQKKCNDYTRKYWKTPLIIVWQT